MNRRDKQARTILRPTPRLERVPEAFRRVGKPRDTRKPK